MPKPKRNQYRDDGHDYVSTNVGAGKDAKPLGEKEEDGKVIIFVEGVDDRIHFWEWS